MKKTIIIVIAAFLAVYLIESFVLWDMNASQWTSEQRTVVPALGIPAALAAAVVSVANSK
jgi:hypothetical protein